MRATVIKAFDGAPDGQLYPRHFAPGDAVEGDLAIVAVREGWAAEDRPAAPLAAAAPATPKRTKA